MALSAAPSLLTHGPLTAACPVQPRSPPKQLKRKRSSSGHTTVDAEGMAWMCRDSRLLADSVSEGSAFSQAERNTHRKRPHELVVLWVEAGKSGDTLTRQSW